MRKKSKSIDVTDIPELLRLAVDVQTTKQSKTLTRGREELVVVQPARPARTGRTRLRGTPTTPDDPIWKLVGIGHSQEPTDISENKHTYLAEAYADNHV